MTPRAEQLAEKAATYLSFEALFGRASQAGRRATLDMLANDARHLGFAPDEINSAVENAIKVAGERGE